MRKPSSTVPWLEPTDPFPSVESALSEASGLQGLLAVGGDLSARRLMDAYAHGIFPWYSDPQPILWWSPDPRMVLELARLRVTRSLLKTLRRIASDDRWEVRIDHAFEQVIGNCRHAVRDGQVNTWITQKIVDAYVELHRHGCAHSFETWHNGKLVGGGYGVGIGRMFYGESMFALQTDASKIALVSLASFLESQHMPIIDCQQNTRHLASLGAHEIPRARFMQHLGELTRKPAPTQWPQQLSLHEVCRFAEARWQLGRS